MFLVTQRSKLIKSIFLTSGSVIVSLLISTSLFAAPERQGVEEILNAAEAVFQNMSKCDYSALWDGLSSQTQRNIVQKVRKAIGNTGHEATEDQILLDFKKGGAIARDYWDAYLTQFQPKTVLEDSVWKMGEVKKDKAEIILRYKKAYNDAILKMYRESGI